MGVHDLRVDHYIAAAKPFAQPILNHLRALVHDICPEVTETIKWQFPVFDYRGQLCHMAAFKEHCVFGLWKAALIPDPDGLLAAGAESAMGQLGKIKTLADLPAEAVLRAFLVEAVCLNREGVKLPRRAKPAADQELSIPEDFLMALQAQPQAHQFFQTFSNSHKREYLEWVTEAKTAKTRQDRLVKTMALLAEGKHLNWKYEKPGSVQFYVSE
jgi:uncharacterized protein YdeI (YjbR/CyaY-like superfamily)